MGTADSALDEQAVSESYGPSAADRGLLLAPMKRLERSQCPLGYSSRSLTGHRQQFPWVSKCIPSFPWYK